MKKILLLLVCIMLFFTHGCFSSKPEEKDPEIVKPNEETVSEEEKLLVKDGVVEYEEEFEVKVNVPLRYYPFIYSKENTWYNENIIGPAKCEEGYLYSKNMTTGVIKKLINVPLKIIRETYNYIYFIYDDGIYYVDYEGTVIKKIYQSDEDIEEDILEIYSDFIYFIEDDNLIKLDLKNDETKVLIEDIDDIDSLSVLKPEEIVYEDDNKYFYVNIEENIYKEITEVEYRQLLAGY